jgi:heterodisulfide reductase subunit D
MAANHDNPFTLENEALVCARCGSCRTSCPVYQVIGWESATPRGKISLAKDIWSKGGAQQMDDDFVKRVGQCTLCGACADICAAGIDTRSLWLEMRHRIAKAGKAPEAFEKLRENLIKNKNISTFPNQDRLEWTQDLDDEPEELELKAGAEILYFVGCVSSFYPQAAQIPLALVEIFTTAGVDFTVMGGEEWCCGFPLLSAGYVEDQEPFINHNVAKVKELDIHTVVTSCATCYNFWKHECQAKIGEYELEILHSTEYLAKLLKEGRLKLGEMDEVITYHDPCDLGRNGGVFEAPREIIRSIPGATFIELAHHHAESLCCGGGGNLQSADATLASDITDLRIKEIQNTGATIVVSACQQCEQMLSDAIRKNGLKVRILDISQLVLEAMG